MQAACMRLLARREHGQMELRRKLVAKGFAAAVVDQVIAELGREGAQSDARFAEVFAHSRVAQGYGPARIRQELRQRGVHCDPRAELGEVDWDQLIAKVHRKKFGDAPPESLREQAAQERFLLGRGFGRDDIRRLFRRLRQGG